MSPGLPRRIKLAFIMQAALASVVITGGVLVTGLIVRDSVISERLDAEAATFWAGRAVDPSYPLPKTATLTGYIVPAGEGHRALPEYMRGLSVGRHRVTPPGRATARSRSA
ncbi:hypothetical protein [Novilysobacter antarcticus]|uniref:hypothetical protein n=1 Tax=Novilysobacter antarcticus TaxID=2862543 RepID=UPI001C98E69F|nr:hypothetical protein [Lysobacter antarcticus]